MKMKFVGLMAAASFTVVACGEGISSAPESELAMNEQESALVLPLEPESNPDELPTPVGAQPGQSSVDAMYYAYLSEAGFHEPTQVGRTEWVNGCSTRAFQGAVTFNRGITNNCVYQPPPGWVAIDTQVNVTKNRNGRGSYSSGILAENGEFTSFYEQKGNQWKLAIERAIKAGDIEVQRKLELEHQNYMLRLWRVGATKNTAFLEVTANGGAFAKSEIEANLRVLLMKL